MDSCSFVLALLFLSFCSCPFVLALGDAGLRAAELCASDDPAKVPIGVAVLDAIDDLPFPGDNENLLIDAVVEEVAQNVDQ